MLRERLVVAGLFGIPMLAASAMITWSMDERASAQTTASASRIEPLLGFVEPSDVVDLACSEKGIIEELTIEEGDILITNGFNITASGAGITNNGTINASSGSGGTSIITLSGSWTNAGTFTAGDSTVVLNSTTNQLVSGDTTFNHLTAIVESARSIVFGVGNTSTIGGITTLQGTADKILTLRSQVTGSRWIIDPQGTRNISYVRVKDSENANTIVKQTFKSN